MWIFLFIVAVSVGAAVWLSPKDRGAAEPADEKPAQPEGMSAANSAFMGLALGAGLGVGGVVAPNFDWIQHGEDMTGMGMVGLIVGAFVFGVGGGVVNAVVFAMMRRSRKLAWLASIQLAILLIGMPAWPFVTGALERRKKRREATERAEATQEEFRRRKERLAQRELERVARMSPEQARERAPDGATPLHLAAQEGSVEKLRLLLDKGADLEARTDTRISRTPLLLAINTRKADAVEYLLERGANPNAPEGLTNFQPLGLACEGRFFDRSIVESLIKHGADLDSRGARYYPPLHAAAEAENVELMGLLLRHGVKIESRNTLGETALSCAVREIKAKAVRFLIKNGADVNAADDQGATPLFALQRNLKIAQASGHPLDKACAEIIELLEAGGAVALPPSNQPDSGEFKEHHGKPRLFWAAETGRIDEVRRLLDEGADPNQRNRFRDEKPIDAAATSGGPEITELLLSRGAKVEPPADCGETPLGAAARAGRVDTARVLLAHGADPNWVGEADCGAGLAPLHLAADRKDQAMAKLLLINRADPNLRDWWGKTPLHHALARGDEAMADLLTAAGADPNAADSSGVKAADAKPPDPSDNAAFQVIEGPTSGSKRIRILLPAAR